MYYSTFLFRRSSIQPSPSTHTDPPMNLPTKVIKIIKKFERKLNLDIPDKTV